MKKIIIKGNKFLLPESWFDITLKDIVQIKTLDEQKETMDLTDYYCAYVNILTGIPMEDLMSLPIERFKSIFESLSSITKSDVPKINDDDFPVIEINNRFYVFDSRIDKMTIGQYIDLNLWTTNIEPLDCAHKVAASFLRPISSYRRFLLKGKKSMGFKLKSRDFKANKYNTEDVMNNSLIFYDNLPVPYLYKCIDFFLLLGQNSKKIIQDYSLKQVK